MRLTVAFILPSEHLSIASVMLPVLDCCPLWATTQFQATPLSGTSSESSSVDCLAAGRPDPPGPSSASCHHLSTQRFTFVHAEAQPARFLLKRKAVWNPKTLITSRRRSVQRPTCQF